MTDQQIIDGLTDVEAMAITAMGEARGDRRQGGSSVEERIAVMQTIRNRARQPARFGQGLKGVCLKPSQYSCWLASDPNRKALLVMAQQLVSGRAELDPLLRETLFLADGVASGAVLDTTNGATHYYSPASMKPVGAVPNWAAGKTPCAHVGGEVFYRGV